MGLPALGDWSFYHPSSWLIVLKAQSTGIVFWLQNTVHRSPLFLVPYVDANGEAERALRR
jgi:hypothetical protein